MLMMMMLMMIFNDVASGGETKCEAVCTQCTAWYHTAACLCLACSSSLHRTHQLVCLA